MSADLLRKLRKLLSPPSRHKWIPKRPSELIEIDATQEQRLSKPLTGSSSGSIAKVRDWTNLTVKEIGFPDPDIVYPQNSLLGCPAEIRLIVAHFLFAEGRTTHSRLLAVQNDRGLTPGVSALQVCRQLYHEWKEEIQRSVLIVPRNYGFVETALPLSISRLHDVPLEFIERMQIREVVVREYLENLNTARISVQFLKPLGINVATVIVQLCVCYKSAMFRRLDFSDHLCTQLRYLKDCLPSARRIIIFSCDLPSYSRVIDNYTRDIRKLFSTMARNGGLESHWMAMTINIKRLTDGLGSLEAPDYEFTFTGPEDIGKRTVLVQLRNSWSELSKHCVLA